MSVILVASRMILSETKRITLLMMRRSC